MKKEELVERIEKIKEQLNLVPSTIRKAENAMDDAAGQIDDLGSEADRLSRSAGEASDSIDDVKRAVEDLEEHFTRVKELIACFVEEIETEDMLPAQEDPATKLVTFARENKSIFIEFLTLIDNLDTI